MYGVVRESHEVCFIIIIFCGSRLNLYHGLELRQ